MDQHHIWKFLNKKGGHFTALLLLFFLFPLNVLAGVPVVADLFVTDVTPVSFSVVWSTSDEACTADLNVYVDENGTTAVSDLDITPHPVLSGDQTIRTAAEDNGVMKVMVTGLEPDTTYYFRSVSTSKDSGDITIYPDTAEPCISVTTQSGISRTFEDNGDIKPFSNDVLIQPCYLSDGSTPVAGSLLIVTIPGSNYPLSAFVGDGVNFPYAIVDLNNAFSSDSGSNVNLGGTETLTLLNARGTNGNSVVNVSLSHTDEVCELAEGEANLKPGANFISFPLEPDNASTDVILSSILDKVNSVWTYDAASGEWLFWDTVTPTIFLSLLNMHPGNGFWLNTSDYASLTIDGNFSSNPVQLYAGSNLVGIKVISEKNVTESIASIYDHVESIWTIDETSGEWLFWDKVTPAIFIQLNTLKPGKAYWINVSQDCDWE